MLFAKFGRFGVLYSASKILADSSVVLFTAARALAFEIIDRVIMKFYPSFTNSTLVACPLRQASILLI
jgi:hypothetical protein